MHFGHMIRLPWCNVSLHGSLHVNQHTDCALTIPRTGRWRFRICTKLIRSAYVICTYICRNSKEDNPGRYVSTPTLALSIR